MLGAAATILLSAQSEVNTEDDKYGLALVAHTIDPTVPEAQLDFGSPCVGTRKVIHLKPVGSDIYKWWPPTKKMTHLEKAEQALEVTQQTIRGVTTPAKLREQLVQSTSVSYNLKN